MDVSNQATTTEFTENLVVGFAMYCDEKGLTLMQGYRLAEDIGDELEFAAEDRRNHLPQEMIDDA